MKKGWLIFTGFLSIVMISGCQTLPVGSMSKPSVSAQVMNSAGEIIGEAVFTETKKGVKIHVTAEKLEPGTKAIHIHETGKCDPPDFKSAGGHFNPTGKEHGFHNPKGFHAGDLPNIKVPQSGKVDVTTVAPGVKLRTDSLLDADGSALIIHEKADDYKTDPAGNAGNRIACASIQEA
ncbi:superoxide dismutase family protein [Domibacillus mangrovi]|uniref:Superoxide dismutase [Cu-Zn] n=1 Tax=Domibacillus mangrovi TaxID=1714354 RepID=A0A1Q5NZY2_9BACI|nr:superoxide dismutase family protein [Domibacillus mangrovi]OKL35580.1 superoxide dismutase [Domibacillus mangrovi]